jgi:hypothetical protein
MNIALDKGEKYCQGRAARRVYFHTSIKPRRCPDRLSKPDYPDVSQVEKKGDK